MSSIKPPLAMPLLPGALVSIDTKDLLNQKIVAFQYNPHQISRSLKPQYYSQKSKGSVYFTAGPTQSISLTVQVTSLGDKWSGLSGLYGQLAALEILLYPSTKQLIQYKKDVKTAKLWAVPPAAPRTYFVWGPKRVLPVELSSMTIKETLFDATLSPIQADVDLQMDVVPILDAEDTEYKILLAQLIAQEVASKMAMVANAASSLTKLAMALV